MPPQNQKPLSGRGVLITGGSQGIGNAIAQACLQAGADVYICARGKEAVERARAELQESAESGQRVFGDAIDVSDLESVKNLLAKVTNALANLAGVVNAAGITGATGLLDETDPTEWMQTVQVNLFGTMLVCREVLPHFRKRGYGNIVNFSGGGATSPRPYFSAYAASKIAVVGLTETLSKELKGTGISVNAIAPGAVNTRMLDDVLKAGADKVGAAAYQGALKQQTSGGTPSTKAVELCVKLLSAETDGLTGRIISAVWDPWQSLTEHAQELESSDIYTLRRILPTDRGLDWK